MFTGSVEYDTYSLEDDARVASAAHDMLPADPSLTPGLIEPRVDETDAVVRVALAVVPVADGTKDDRSLRHVTMARLMEKKKLVIEKETQLQRWSVSLDREGARQRRVAETLEAEMSAAENLILTITANGAGKLSSSHDYPLRGRGGMGVSAMDKAMRGGRLLASFPVELDDQIMLATSNGQSIRVPVEGISFRSRSAGGVRVFNTAKGEEVVSVAWIADQGDQEGVIEGEAESGET